MKLISTSVKTQLLGFAVTGVLSTLVMFSIYVGLYQFINYQYAYFIAYSISIIALYFMNIWVFNGSISIQTFLQFPLIYLLQYIISAASLELMVRLGFSITLAPLLVIVALLPITFLLNRMVFSRK